MFKTMVKIRSVLDKVQATEFAMPGHVFYQLNELPKGAVTILKKLSISRYRKVFGIKNNEKGTAIA